MKNILLRIKREVLLERKLSKYNFGCDGCDSNCDSNCDKDCDAYSDHYFDKY